MNGVTLANNNELTALNVIGETAGLAVTADNAIINATINTVNTTLNDNGLNLIARNGGTLTVTVANSSFNQVNENGIRANIRDAGSNIALTVNNSASNNNVMDGILFDAYTGGSFTGIVSNTNLSNNGRNAIRAVLAGGSVGSLVMTDVVGNGSGEHGMFISATDSTLTPSTFLCTTLNNSGQDGTDGLADAFNFDITNSQASVTIVDSVGTNIGGGLTQENGLRFRVDMAGSLTTTVIGSNFSDNRISAFNATVRDMGTTAILNINNTLGDRSRMDGFFFDIAAGTFTANVNNASFNQSGRNAIRAIGGGTPAVVNVAINSTTSNNSVAEGVFFDIDGLGGPSTLNFDYGNTAPNSPRYSTGATGLGSNVSKWFGPPSCHSRISDRLFFADLRSASALSCMMFGKLKMPSPCIVFRKNARRLKSRPSKGSFPRTIARPFLPILVRPNCTDSLPESKLFNLVHYVAEKEGRER